MSDRTFRQRHHMLRKPEGTAERPWREALAPLQARCRTCDSSGERDGGIESRVTRSPEYHRR